MTGIAIFAHILKRNPYPHYQSLHHFPLLSTAAAASLGAATAAPSFRLPVAYCDVGTTAEWDGLDASHLPHASENQISDSWNYRLKEYPIEVKPLFSAFGLKSLAITSLRSFLMYYLPLLEPRPPKEEDDDDDVLQETSEEKPVDLLTPFQNSVKQIAREVSVVTTRRVLERLAVHYTSQRMAWKLLKDVPKSAVRKARRGLPFYLYVYSVSKTTFRGHLLGVTAAWFVQNFIEVYRCFFCKHNDDDVEVETDMSEKIRNFQKKLYGTTIRCGASLVFASIGAGIGALIHPSTGQWFGCVLGDFAGPIITVLWFERMNWQI